MRSLNTGFVLGARSRLWLLSAVVLTLTCLDSPLYGPAEMSLGRLVTGLIYNLYLVVSLGLLVRLWRHSDRLERSRGWWSVDIVVSTFLVVQGMKLLTGLPRPSGGPGGFPSGHTTIAFALAGLILEAYPRLAWFWFVLAVAIGWSRVEVHAHFTYQVFGGCVVGAGLAFAVSHLPQGLLFPRCLGWKKSEPAS